ncbi:MAG: hypothetical protein CMP39_01745 [Rickettsiales bacterium]|nr:hypothetical protein [Rickettsiales bacterium]
MMKKLLWLLFILCCFSISIFGQNIADVSPGDRSYSPIKSSVKKGYLSLYSDNTFRPDQSLTRKEVAIMLDQILKYVDSNKLSISSADIQDLNRLSQTFRESFVNIESNVITLNDLTTDLVEEQQTIQYDLTEYHQTVKSLKEQNQYLWVGIGVAAVLGILF